MASNSSPQVQHIDRDEWIEAPDGIGFVRRSSLLRPTIIEPIELPKVLLWRDQDRKEEEEIRASGRALHSARVISHDGNGP